MTTDSPVILDNIPMKLDLPPLLSGLRIKPESREAVEFGKMCYEATRTGRPKVIYRLAYMDSVGIDTVKINGIEFKGRLLAVNLAKIHRVFPYVVTGGVELEVWSGSFSDFLHQFWADTIKGCALGTALQALHKDIEHRYNAVSVSSMNPGSLAEWPITEQEKLFKLVGDPHQAIGVTLTENSLMLPLKTVSGILYESDENFINCRLCPREKCPGRRAPYDVHSQPLKLGP